jgi:hypothetical protein
MNEWINTCDCWSDGRPAQTGAVEEITQMRTGAEDETSIGRAVSHAPVLLDLVIPPQPLPLRQHHICHTSLD